MLNFSLVVTAIESVEPVYGLGAVRAYDNGKGIIDIGLALNQQFCMHKDAAKGTPLAGDGANYNLFIVRQLFHQLLGPKPQLALPSNRIHENSALEPLQLRR